MADASLHGLNSAANTLGLSSAMGKRRVVKKKATPRRRPPKQQAPAAAETTHARPTPRSASEPSKRGPSLGNIAFLIVGLALLTVAVFLFLPKNLDQIKGYPFDPEQAPKPPVNLLRNAQDQLLERGGTFTVSEAELNTYLNQRLQRVQRGPLTAISDIRGVYLDLRPRQATAFVERRILGIPIVISSTWDYYLSKDSYVFECRSSSAGQMTFPGAMFRPIMMPFLRFAAACEREYEFLQNEAVQKVALEEDQLVITFAGGE